MFLFLVLCHAATINKKPPTSSHSKHGTEMFLWFLFSTKNQNITHLSKIVLVNR